MKCFRHYEPTLGELMADDLLGIILARQGMPPGRFERMMLDMAERLSRLRGSHNGCGCDLVRKQ